jgi:hypothetical protein
MSLHTAAQHLASKGRGGDTELVHMTRGEIKGLQELALAHGGSLSINPDTGLVEANFLKRLLPMIAGAALAATGIGAPAAAMIVGGFEGIRTGDIGKGLAAGLGAYGGAGVGAGLAGAASSAGTSASAANALGVPSSAMQANAALGLPTTVGTGATSQAGMLAAENAAMGLTPLQSASQISGSAGYAAGATPPSTFNLGSSLMRSGAQRLLDDPAEGAKAVYKAMPTGTLPALGTTVAGAMTPEAPGAAPGVEPDEYDKRLAAYRLSPNFSGFVPRQPQPYYRPTGLGYTGYAEGGNVMEASRGAYDDEPMSDVGRMAAGGIAAYSNQGQVRHLPESVSIPRTGIFRDPDVDTARKDALEATRIRNKKLASSANMPKNFLAKQPKTSVKGLGDVEEVAAGGSIGGYSDGGRMLRGPGDGMSDSIPATIGKRQPARLADGEFVVPADVVSHLGNGSTDAGAKKLYSMMDKIRKARTGKKAQAKAIKADKYMPA